MSAPPLKPPALDPSTVPGREGTNYPANLGAGCDRRRKQALGDAVGLTHFGVNLVHMPPGQASALRHWHAHEDEFVYVLEGELVLVADGGEQVLRPGMAAGFPAGRADGHHLINRTDRDAVYLEVGDRATDETVEYPDVDLRLERHGASRTYLHRDGTPYPRRS